MSIRKKHLLFFLLVVLPLLVILFFWFLGTPLLTISLETLASFLLEAQVSLEAAHLSSSTLQLRGIAIEQFRQNPLKSFHAAEILFRFRPIELLQGKLRAVDIDHPVLILTQSETAGTTSPPLSVETIKKLPLLRTFHLEEGKVEVISPDRQFGLTQLRATLTLSQERETLHLSLQGNTFPEVFPLAMNGRLDWSSPSPTGELSLSLSALPLPLLVLFLPSDLLPPKLQMEGTIQLQLSAHLRDEKLFGEMEGKLTAWTFGFPHQMATPGEQRFTLHFSGSLQDRQSVIEEATFTVPSLGEVRLLTPFPVHTTPFPNLSLAFQLSDLQDLEQFFAPFAPALDMQGKGEGTIEVHGQEEGSTIAVDARFLPVQVAWEPLTFPLESVTVQAIVQTGGKANTVPLTGKMEGKFRQGESLLLTFNTFYTPSKEHWQFSPLVMALSPQEKVSLEGHLTHPFSPQAVADLTYRVSSFSLSKGKRLLKQIWSTFSLPTLQGTVTANGKIIGPLSNLEAQGEGSIKEGKMETDRFLLQGTLSKADYHLRYPSLTFAIQLLVGELNLRAQENFSLPSLQVRGEGTFNLSTLAYTFRPGTVRMGKEEVFALSAEGKFSSPQLHALTLQADQLQVGKIWEMLNPTWFPSYQEWAVGGMLAFQGEGKVEEIAHGYSYALTTHIDMQQGNFQSPDGTKAMENLKATVEATARGETIAETVHFTAQGSAGNFAVLFGEFGEIYGNFSGKFLQFDTEGSYQRNTSPLVRLQGEGNLGKASKLTFAGTLTHFAPQPTGELSLEVTVSSLETLYQNYMSEVFQTTFPSLQAIQIAGTGRVKAHLQGSDERFRLTGSLDLQEGKVEWQGENVAIRGLTMNLPFTLRLPAPSTPRSPNKQDYGKLAFHTLLLPSVTFSDIALQPAVVDNVLTLKDPLHLPLFGGKMNFAQVRIAHLLSAQRQLSAALQIENIDLQPLTRTYLPVTIAGTLNGSFSRILLQGGDLQTKGEITVRAFGGQIQVVHISGEDLFSPIPTLRMAILGKGLDLAMLTQTFDFGLITGSLDLYATDLEVVNGQPQSFEAVIETVKRPGQDQHISIDAVEKLATLGEGSSFLDKGLASFFEEYNYEKIGIWAKLRNDTFFLRGTLQRGDKELFLKGKGLPRLDIVNYASPQGISFKDMVQRLQRLGAATPPQ